MVEYLLCKQRVFSSSLNVSSSLASMKRGSCGGAGGGSTSLTGGCASVAESVTAPVLIPPCKLRLTCRKQLMVCFCCSLRYCVRVKPELAKDGSFDDILVIAVAHTGRNLIRTVC